MLKASFPCCRHCMPESACSQSRSCELNPGVELSEDKGEKRRLLRKIQKNSGNAQNRDRLLE